MNQSPTDPVNNVTVRELDWGAEVRKAWGPKWNEPSVEYVFGTTAKQEKKFYRRTEDFGPYNP